MEGFKNMDELFRENLHDYSQNPPEEVWYRIEKSLLSNRKKTLWPLYIRVAASILFLAGLTIITWKYLAKDNKTQFADEQTSVTANQGALYSESAKNTDIAVNQRSRVSATQNEAPANSGHTGRILNSSINENIENQAQTEEQQALTDVMTENTVLPQIDSSVSATDGIQSTLAEQEIKTVSKENSVSTLASDDLIIQQNLLALEQQNSQSKEQRPVLWSVGGEAGPQYSYRDVNVNTSNLQNDYYDQYEKGVVAFAGGVNVEMEPLNRFSIQSGVFYSKIGQIKDNLQFDGNGQIGEAWFNPNSVFQDNTRTANVVNSTGNITFDKELNITSDNNSFETWEPGVITAEQYFEFIEVPFVCSYKIVDRKWDIDVSSGLWANFLVGNEAYATYNDTFTVEGETDDINSFNYSASLAVGFAYPFGKHLSINMQPLFKYYLTPINSNPQTEVHPYSVSLMTGIHYTF
jgi:hypothetical protein